MKISPKIQGKRIAVLCGGRSREREISLRSGKNVLAALKRLGFNVITIDPEAIFPEGDFIAHLKSQKIDFVYNILHGEYGEDGTIQAILDFHGIPYTGSKVLASALSMNKVAAKRIFQAAQIPTADFVAIQPEQGSAAEADRVQALLGLPVVIKPISEGSSFGVTLVKRADELPVVIDRTLAQFPDVMAEAYIKGREVTVGVIGVGERVKALPILELIPKNEFYDFEAKYTPGMTEFVLPAKLSEALTRKTQTLAVAAHEAIGCHGVSRVDFLIGTDEIPRVLEVNTTPGMTDQSDLPAAAAHVGIDFDKLVLLILESALPVDSSLVARSIS